VDICQRRIAILRSYSRFYRRDKEIGSKPGQGSEEMSDIKGTDNKSAVPKDDEEKRVGVFVCECGVNIGGVVNTKAVADYIGTLPGVKVTSVNKFTCSDSGQADIQSKNKRA